MFHGRWPGSFRPLRLDALGTCSCDVIQGEVSCKVLVTRLAPGVVTWGPGALGVWESERF